MTIISSNNIEQTRLPRKTWRIHRLPAVDGRRRMVAYGVTLVLWLALVCIGLALGSFPLAEIARSVKMTLGSSYGLQQTLMLAAPLILTGTAVAVTARLGIWNIGAEGQFYMGALAATAVGLFLPQGPGWLMLVLMGVAAALSGAAWIIIPAIGRAYAGINEIITTLLFSFVATYIVGYLGTGPWRDPLVPTQAATQRIPYDLPALGDGAHLGVPIALACVAVIGLFMQHSKWGYEIIVAGANSHNAEYAGIPLKRRIIQVMLISGAFAGLSGMVELSGVVHRLQGGMSNQYGYLGIPIAALAGGSFTGVVIAALFFAVLLNIGVSLQIYGLSVHSVLGITGLLLFLVAIAETLARFSIRREDNETAMVKPQ